MSSNSKTWLRAASSNDVSSPLWSATIPAEILKSLTLKIRMAYPLWYQNVLYGVQSSRARRCTSHSSVVGSAAAHR